MVAALLAHHGYESGSVLNWEPATIAALAKLAGVSTSTASRWLANIFGADKGEGYERYRAACQGGLLATVLTALAEPQRLARCITVADVDAASRRIPRRRR
jgi:DNA-binding MurR/RpiR family transcriptional regulator